MAQTFSTELAGIDSVPAVKPSATNGYAARLKRFRATFTLAAQSTGAGNELVVCDLPAGYVFAYAMITPSVTLGTSTLALGNASSSTAYAPATTYTATVPTPAGSAAGVSAAALTASTRVLATIGVAALPGAGTLVIDVFASLPN